MMHAVYRLAAAAALALALAPGAFADDPVGDAADEAPACVRVGAINGYSVIDSRHLLLNSGASDHFLVTTRTRCSGMRAGTQIGLSFSDNSRICQPATEFIIPDDGWRCAISTLEEVESEEAARALIEARAQAAATPE